MKPPSRPCTLSVYIMYSHSRTGYPKTPEGNYVRSINSATPPCPFSVPPSQSPFFLPRAPNPLSLPHPHPYAHISNHTSRLLLAPFGCHRTKKVEHTRSITSHLWSLRRHGYRDQLRPPRAQTGRNRPITVCCKSLVGVDHGRYPEGACVEYCSIDADGNAVEVCPALVSMLLLYKIQYCTENLPRQWCLLLISTCKACSHSQSAEPMQRNEISPPSPHIRKH